MKLFTIGFTKKSAETFFELLRENGVQRLVDIWIISMEKPLPILRLSRVRGYRDKIIEMSRLTEQPLDAELNENELLPDDFTITLRQMAGMRNRLVHLYWEVDDEVIYDILSTNLDDFDIFTRHILTYVKSLSSNQNY